MPMIIKNNVRYCSTGGDAENIVYDNAESGMEATNMQDAIDELNSNLEFDYSSKAGISSIKDALQFMWDKLYPKVLYLIHNSVIYDFYIGKWITESTTGIGFGVSESSEINIIVQGAGTGYAYTEKMIDVTNFTNLKVSGTFQGRNHGNSDSNNILKIGVGVIKEFTTYDSTTNNTTDAYNFEYSIDLSNVDGEKNFIITIERTGAFGSVLTINEICFS